MEYVDQFILGIGLLLLPSVLASRLSDRLGAPLLLVFLAPGMLAGQDGPGGIVYNSFTASALLASLALGVILFDGGLRTAFWSFRAGLGPALLLATVGVVISSAITGAAASVISDLPWLQGLLL